MSMKGVSVSVSVPFGVEVDVYGARYEMKVDVVEIVSWMEW